MADEKTSKTAPKKKPSDRELRLKAALKANLGRRKTQARARNASPDATQAKDNT
jgi:hypothetical protein